MHKLQPLDVAVYNPFKTYYGNAIGAWHRNHHGMTMNIYDIPAATNSAYVKAFNHSNITNGFRACGIYPYDNDIFSDSEFSSSYIIDCPDPAVEINVKSNCPVPKSTAAFPEDNCCPAVSTSANQYEMNVESTCSVPTSHALPDNGCQDASTSVNHCEINVESNCLFPTSPDSVLESDCLLSFKFASQCELNVESICPSPTNPAALSRFDNMIATPNNSSRDDLQPTIIFSNSYVFPAA